MLPWEKRLSMTVGTFVEASTVPSVRSAGPTLWQEGVGEVSQKEGRRLTLEYHRYHYRTHLKYWRLQSYNKESELWTSRMYTTYDCSVIVRPFPSVTVSVYTSPEKFPLP